MIHSLHMIPDRAHANKVKVASAHHGRPCLRTALDAASRAGKPGVDYADRPSCLLLPEVMENGVIEIDLLATFCQMRPIMRKASSVGLAYRVQDNLSACESV